MMSKLTVFSVVCTTLCDTVIFKISQTKARHERRYLIGHSLFLANQNLFVIFTILMISTISSIIINFALCSKVLLEPPLLSPFKDEIKS